MTIIKKFRQMVNHSVIKIGSLLLVLGIIISGMIINIPESKAEIKEEKIKIELAKPIYNNNYKVYAFNINNTLITLTENQLYNVIYEYIKENVSKSKNNPAYIAKVTKCYIRLFDECGNNDAVLRFIGLCAVESRFNCNIKSCCGVTTIAPNIE